MNKTGISVYYWTTKSILFLATLENTSGGCSWAHITVTFTEISSKILKMCLLK